MVSIIICGHSDLAEGILSASEMVFGKMEQLTAVKFLPNEGVPNLLRKYEEAAALLGNQDEILFMADIFGGSPYNAAAQYVALHPGADVVTGVCLPMLIEALDFRNTMALSEVVVSLKESFKNYFYSYSEVMAQQSDDDDL